MAEDWASGVYPHGAITPLASNLWWVKSSQKGMPLPRNMVIYRLASGDLVIHSGVCLEEAEMTRLEALGTPRYLIVPNEGHRSDAPRFKARYPALTVLAPSGAREKVQEVVPVDALCEDVLPGLGIVCHAPDGMKPSYELLYEVDVEGGKALIVNDVLANGPKMTGFQGMIFNLLGSGGVFGQARIVRFFFSKDKARFRAFVEKLATGGPWKVITVSHGDPVTESCNEALRAAAARL